MLLEKLKREKSDYSGHGPRFNTVFKLKCDHCGTVFEKYLKPKKIERMHFCDLKCCNDAQQNGVFVSASFSSPEKVRLGAGKRKQTMKDRYGAEGTFASPELSIKARSTMYERFGEAFPQRLEDTKQKMKVTNIKRWGHECTLHSKQISGSIDRLSLYQKAHETMKQRGLLYESRIERAVRDALITSWSKDSIVTHPFINGWSIDVFIKPISTYVQVDGAFWHGLDRPIEIVKETHPKIYRKWCIDREQERWFSNQANVKLVRLVDTQLREHGIEETLRKNVLLNTHNQNVVIFDT